MQILISLLPFQNLRAYLKFQKLDEGIHRETKLSSKFPRIVDIKKPSFFKIPSWPIIWRPRSSSSCSSLEDDMFWRSNICFTSRTQCLQVTCDLYFHLWFTSWTLVKIQVRTLVKVLLNWTLTIFYTCSATPIITSQTLVTWICDEFY